MGARVEHTGRTTTPATKPVPALTRETLELCDWLIDGITIAANHPDFEAEAAKVGRAKRQITAALTAAGGTPLGVQRQQQPT